MDNEKYRLAKWQEKIENEKELVMWLKTILEKAGWIVKTWVKCDETKHWEHPWEADIIAYHPKYTKLNPIGIELKFLKGSMGRKGSIFAQAFRQIMKYKNKHFDGKEVKVWCLGVYALYHSNYDSIVFVREFFNSFKFGIIELNAPRLVIHFAYSQGDMKIDIAGLSKWDNSFNMSKHQTNEDKILKKIEQVEEWKEKFIPI